MEFHLGQLAVAALFATAPSVALAADELEPLQVGELLGRTRRGDAGRVCRVGCPARPI